MTSKRTIRVAAALAVTASLVAAAPAAAQTGGVPGGTAPTTTTSEPTATPSTSPGSWTVNKAATWYGPGFWGKQTACGVTLTPTTLGVAHRKLPCGTQVTFSYGARSVTATVIDRGPFHKGFAWDLTKKTAKRIGFLEVGSGPITATVSPAPTTTPATPTSPTTP